MDTALAITAPRHSSNARGRVHSRSVSGTVDVAGILILVTTLLLGAYFATDARALQFGMYAICLVAVLPHVGPFVASLRRNAATLLLVLLFLALALSTFGAWARVP